MHPAARWSQCVRAGLVLRSAIIGVVPPCLAEPGQTAWTTYLRAGPGLQFAVLDEIEAHKTLDVQDCRGGWCRVVSGDAEGYVAADHLAAPGPPAPKAADHAPVPCFRAQQTGFRGGDEVQFCGK